MFGFKIRIKLYLVALLCIITLIQSGTSVALTSDFSPSKNKWVFIKDKDHTGEQKILTIKKNPQEKILLYWMSPGSKSKIQFHDQYEEVVITQGSLNWLDEDNSVQKILKVGDYVDRKPNVKHGPFRAGPDGCMMFVRFH